MVPRRSFCLAFAPVCASALFGQEGQGVPAMPCTPEALNKSIEAVMQAIDAIKPGMTRADMLTIFREDSGITSPSLQRYVFRLCPYIKVDFEFERRTNSDDQANGNDDKILKLSRPYLQYSGAD